jgi:glutaredoxin 3
MEEKTGKRKMKYKIYATVDCRYCTMAKKLLESKEIEFEYLTMPASSPIMEEIKTWTGQMTVPLIFEVTNNRERFIGGFTELNKIINGE